jgi:pimeloyl-ACP methyl ester carboxylesterase
MLQPYHKDKIPVLFVHGLMSSPVTWVQLFNDVLHDPVLRERYQFWFFGYPSGNPILYSASNLRVYLLQIQQTYDPEGTNPAFQNMVICSHSMGGLVSKLMVLSSGDRLWSMVFDTPIEETELSADERALLTRTVFFETLPFIKRVVFMAVPHRGSDLATGFVGKLGMKLTSLPERVSTTLSSLRARMSRRSEAADENSATGIGNLAQTEILTWPFPDYLQIHSVIGNLDAAETPGGADGIVPYESSHLEGVASEKIVKWGHNVHEHPLAILELRRILHLHLHLDSLKSPAEVGQR